MKSEKSRGRLSSCDVLHDIRRASKMSRDSSPLVYHF